MKKTSDVSVGVIFSRPEKALKFITYLLDSYIQPSTLIFVIIGNETPYGEIFRKLDATFAGKVISRFVYNGGPAELRNLVLESCTSDQILILDDDIYLKPHTIGRFLDMRKTLHYADASVLGCAVIENGMVRELASNFTRIWRDGQLMLRLDQITLTKFQTLRHEIEQVDLITQPPFFISGLNKSSVNFRFDQNYPWAYEIFDWFLALEKQGVVCAVAPFIGATHDPGGYERAPDWKIEKNQAGLVYFIKKWNVYPEKYFRHSFIFSKLREVFDYYGKKIRILVKKNL